jgi:hypothetical protein
MKKMLFGFFNKLFFKADVYQMEKGKMNVIYIPVGQLPRAEAEEYIASVQKYFTYKGYETAIIGVPS